MAITINGTANTIAGLAVGGLPDGVVDSDTIATSVTTGKVLQVVTGVTTTEAVNETESYTDTNLTCNITPTSASNKVLVMIDQHFYFKRSSDAGMGVRILRDSTVIHTPATNNNSGQDWLVDINTDPSHFGMYGRKSMTILDTIPGSWSSGAITYKTQACVWDAGSNAKVVSQPDLNGDDSTSRIILMEIAA